MDNDAREAEEKAWRRKNAHRRCPKCGAYTLERISGEKLDPTTHFAGIVYAICNGCGYDMPVRSRR